MKQNELSQKYGDYVASFEDKPRYDDKTKQALERFFELASSFTGEGEAETLYEAMLDIATSFEELGFVEGYKRGLANI